MSEDTNDGFPFNEYGQGKLRRDIGETDYYRSWQEAKDAGWDDNQIWSVTGEDNTHLYGPPHHYVNHIGHIATEERHDGKTYYEESWENDDLYSIYPGKIWKLKDDEHKSVGDQVEEACSKPDPWLERRGDA